MRKRGWRELIVLLAALACAGSWAASQVRSIRDRSEVAQMTEKMRTVCVGRYLVDVPAQAEVSFSGAVLDGFAVDTIEETEAEFRERVAAREAEIAARPPANNGTGGMVEARDLRIPGIAGRTFIFGRNRGYWFEDGRRVDDEWVAVEVHAHTEGLSISLSAKSADEGRAAMAEVLLARLKVFGKDEVPGAPGFCIWRAMFVEPLPGHKSEHVVMHLGLPGHQDMGLVLSSIAGGTPPTSLLTRFAQAEANTHADVLLRMNKLREGKRLINGIEGEEVLLRVREFNFTTTYGLSWDASGVKDNLLQPSLSLELQTGISERPGGKPVDTSLHEDALLALWDRIASSIRLREGSPPPRSSPPPEPAGPKLGAVANAGDICPQSGWWRCSEGAPGIDVHGGQVQYLRKGDRMPQALLLPRQTLWQKLKRVQPSIESAQPTAWTLVDKRLRARTATALALAPAVMPATGSDVASDDANSVPLGSYVRTGEACSASGWWRCEEPHALDGTRWFARGSLLPAATFQVPAGVFAKSAGPEVIQRRSVWQLVRHADASALAQHAQALSGGSPVAEPPALVRTS
jgi:hypothetical protein